MKQDLLVSAIAALSINLLSVVGASGGEIERRVTNGAAIHCFALCVTNVSYPQHIIREDLPANLPLKTNITVVTYDSRRGTIAALYGTNAILLQKDSDCCAGIMGPVASEVEAKSIIKWLHGGSSLGSRVSTERVHALLSLPSGTLAELNVSVIYTNILNQAVVPELYFTNDVYFFHMFVYQGVLTEYYHAVSSDGMYSTVRRDIAVPNYAAVSFEAAQIPWSPEWLADRANAQLAKPLEDFLQPKLDRGD